MRKCGAGAARILPCFLPFTSTGDVAEAKMVDFVLAPGIRPDSDLDAAIQAKLMARAVQQPPALVSAHLCVNQTELPSRDTGAHRRDHRDQGCWREP